MASMNGRSSGSEERSGKRSTGARSSTPWPMPEQNARASASVSKVSGSPNMRVSSESRYSLKPSRSLSSIKLIRMGSSTT